MPVREAVYVDRQRFWSYTCTVDACCSPLGSPLRDAMSTEVAAAYVLEGRSPLPSRAFAGRPGGTGRPATRGEVADAVRPS